MKQQVQAHITRKYQLLKKIGSGAYGHVWKVADKQTKQIYALKKIFDAFQHSTDAQRTYRQIMFLQQFEHENIIKLYEVIRAENDQDIYLVFQYMEIDLHSVIRQNILKQKHKKYIIYQTAKALKYLHSANLIHRDLKPSNVLINSNCLVKVCDFGLVRSLQNIIQDQPPVLTQYIATRWYRAPEILFGSTSYTKGIDIWSFGCMVVEMFSGKPLFPGSSTINQIQRVLGWTGMPNLQDINSLYSDLAATMISNIKGIKHKKMKQWLPHLDEQASDLISKMLIFNPSKRISIQQILSHPYLQDFHNPLEQISCGKHIQINVNDNQKLTVKQYRQLIYKQISRKYDKKYKQLEDFQIKCDKIISEKYRRKQVKSISRQEQRLKEIQNSIIAKTLYIPNKKSNPYTNSPDVPFSKPQSIPKKQFSKKIKYFTQSKDTSMDFNPGDRIAKSKILSIYNKKKSLKDTRELTKEKRESFDDALRKKNYSIYTSSQNTQILRKYLTKNLKNF